MIHLRFAIITIRHLNGVHLVSTLKKLLQYGNITPIWHLEQLA